MNVVMSAVVEKVTPIYVSLDRVQLRQFQQVSSCWRLTPLKIDRVEFIKS